MKLTHVFYEIYELDYQALLGHEDDLFHALDREVRLDFDDANSIWISWSSEPRQFCIGYWEKSQFKKPIPVILNMSQAKLWHPLIGNNIELEYNSSERDFLKIYGVNYSLWCWAEGSEGSDVLHISNSLPEP